MRLIDADALIAQMEADAEQMEEPIAKMFTYAAISDVKHAPTVKPERNYDEWCLDCKEYDHDRHCCPRFNRVIGSVMDEIKTDRKLEKIMKGKHDD